MKILFLILFTLGISSCNNDSNPTSATVINNSYFENPYKGNWNITLRSLGDTTQIIGSGTISIREDGSFSNNLNLYNSYIFSGDVQSNGRLENGKIFDNNGNMNQGILTGIFANNFGKGIWKSSSGSYTIYTWVGVKQ